MRWINRAGVLAVAVVVIVGPPLAAVLWLSERHREWPTSAEAQRWLEEPLSAGTIVVGLGLVAATAWLLLAGYLLRLALRRLAAGIRRMRQMPLPSSAQVTAGSLAGVAAFAMPSLVVPHADVTHADVSTAVPQFDGGDAGTTTGDEMAVERAGVALPGGGWLPYRTAAAVAALAGMLWLYRRHAYRPGPPRFGRHHHDADLSALPPTVDAITAILAADDAAPPAVAPATLVNDLPPGRLALYGPGAIDAVRGLLVTAVLGAALTGHVTITIDAEDLRNLLDIDPGDQLPGVTAEDSDSTAGSPQPNAPGQPSLIITRRARPADGELPPDRGNAGSELISTEVIFVGAGASSSAWHVAADGAVTTAAALPIRLPQLPRQAAADLIGLVHQHQNAREQAHPPTTTPTEPGPGQKALGRLTVLGGCELSIRGAPVRLQRSAGWQVLAYLAVHPDGATTGELVRAIWPGIAPATITARLYTTVTGLRHQFQPELADPVQHVGDRYQLNPNAIDTDVQQLRQALDAVPTAITVEQRHHAARRLTQLYRGELAEGFSWPWLQPAREAVRRDLIDAYLHLAHGAEPALVVDLIQAATRVDPYNADLHRRAQALLAATGQHSAARDLDHSFRLRLSQAGLNPPAEPESPPRPTDC